MPVRSGTKAVCPQVSVTDLSPFSATEKNESNLAMGLYIICGPCKVACTVFLLLPALVLSCRSFNNTSKSKNSIKIVQRRIHLRNKNQPNALSKVISINILRLFRIDSYSSSAGSLLYMQFMAFIVHPRWLAANTIKVEYTSWVTYSTVSQSVSYLVRQPVTHLVS